MIPRPLSNSELFLISIYFGSKDLRKLHLTSTPNIHLLSLPPSLRVSEAMSRRLPISQYVESWQIFSHEDYIDWAMELGHPRPKAEHSWDTALRAFPGHYRNVSKNGNMELWICVSYGWQQIQSVECGGQRMSLCEGFHYTP